MYNDNNNIIIMIMTNNNWRALERQSRSLLLPNAASVSAICTATVRQCYLVCGCLMAGKTHAEYTLKLKTCSCLCQADFGFKAEEFHAADFSSKEDYVKKHGSDLFMTNVEEYDRICKVRKQTRCKVTHKMQSNVPFCQGTRLNPARGERRKVQAHCHIRTQHIKRGASAHRSGAP